MKRFIFAILLFILSFSHSLSGQNQITVAVLNLDANGISEMEARTLSDELRRFLVSSNEFQVLERDNMEAILKEQGFQQSGCTSSECVVEAGKLLGVQKMVAGNIGKIGDLFNVTVRLIDVSSGKIVSNVAERYDGDIEGLLDVMGRIAGKLHTQGDQKPLMVRTEHMFTDGFGLRVGMNYFGPDNGTSEASVNAEIGFEAGIFYRYGLGKKFALQLEALFTRSNAGIDLNVSESIPIDIPSGVKIWVNHVQIPLTIHYHFATVFELFTGFNVILPLSQSENLDVPSSDIGLLAGINLGQWDHFSVQLKYAIGFSSEYHMDPFEEEITDTTWDIFPEGNYRAFTLSVGYTF